MTKKEYLDYGKKYLNSTTKQKLEFYDFYLKNFPVAKQKVFTKWLDDVNRHKSHIKTSQEPDKYHLDRLEKWLNGKK